MDGARFQGTLIQWNDERGFGFIRPDADPSDKIFLHIKEVRATRRPAMGDVVTFSLDKQRDGRMRATFGRIQGAEREPDSFTWPWIAAIFCITSSIIASVLTNFFWPVLLYPVGSVITMILYLSDKSSAKSGGWRVSESTLHSWEFLGGWPGALSAQQSIRHKVSKESYQFIFKGIIWLHTIAWIVVLGYLVLFQRLQVFDYRF